MVFDTPIITNDQSIDRVLTAGLPIALVFLNDEPPPALSRAMDRLAQENAGEVLVVKVRIKDSPAVARRYQINATPALVTIRSGQLLAKTELISSADLEGYVAFLLGKGPQPRTARPSPGAASARAAPGAHTEAGGGRPLVVSDATFDRDVLGSPEPVLVDFWAPWCGPCRMVEPIVEKLAREGAGRLRVAKLNVDENPAVAERYGVYSIPTMMVVRNGQIIDRWAGALPENALRQRVQALLGR